MTAFIKRIEIALLVACMTAGAQCASAQADAAKDYPSKPIRWIVDFGAGGLSDTLARILAQRLTEAWGQPVLVEPRPGANGTIAYDMAAKAPPDGYTLVFISTPFSIGVSVYDKLPYDVRRDFAPITLIATYPNLLVTNTSVPAKSVAELIAYAKGKSPNIVWASVGAGSSPFLATELFRRQAGFDGVHVPYNASQVALTDLVGGRIEFMFVNMPGAMTFIRSNRIRTIGIAAPTRSALMPDVPTIAESGLPGFQSVGYAGVAAPSKVPRAIIDKLNAELVRALKLPEVQERIQNLGGEPRSSSPDEFKQLLEDEITRWAPVAREAGVKLER